MPESIIIFVSVHAALSGEKALKDQGIEHQVVPVPPHVNGGCGIGIKVVQDSLAKALAIFQSQDVQVEQVISTCWRNEND